MTSRNWLLTLLALTAGIVAGRKWMRRAKRHPLGRKALAGPAPMDAVDLYFSTFHFTNGDMGQQIETHHFCTILNDDVAQCVIYDGNGPAATLLGIEYLISERLFCELPEEEKQLWHSHEYEVKSGEMAIPGLPRKRELELLNSLRKSYGKIWQTWDVHGNRQVPLGIPKLLMAFTDEGQIHPALVAERDRLLQISTARNRASRALLPNGPVIHGADTWQIGQIKQLTLASTGMTYQQNND